MALNQDCVYPGGIQSSPGENQVFITVNRLVSLCPPHTSSPCPFFSLFLNFKCPSVWISGLSSATTDYPSLLFGLLIVMFSNPTNKYILCHFLKVLPAIVLYTSFPSRPLVSLLTSCEASLILMSHLPVDVNYIQLIPAFLAAWWWRPITYFILINGMESP